MNNQITNVNFTLFLFLNGKEKGWNHYKTCFVRGEVNKKMVQ